MKSPHILYIVLMYLPQVNDIAMLLPAPKYAAIMKSLHMAPIKNPVKPIIFVITNKKHIIFFIYNYFLKDTRVIEPSSNKGTTLLSNKNI